MTTAPWKIKNIRVDGLLHSHDLFWEVFPKVNILGGPNGSGKSTLLHALALLLQGAPQEVSRQTEFQYHSQALFDSLSTEFVSGVSINVRRTCRSTHERIKDEDLEKSGKMRLKVKEEIELNGSSSVPDGISTVQLPDHIIYLNSFEQSLASISTLLEKSSQQGRPALTTLDLMLEQTLNTRNQLFTQRMGSALQDSDIERVENLRNLFGRFETAVKVFMPQYKIIDISTLLFEREDNHDSHIRYYRLSTGEKQLLYLLLTVCNTLGEPTILLMDEADLGMHIDWKRKLLKELLHINPDMQILAATHSPSLIEGWLGNVREISQLYRN